MSGRARRNGLGAALMLAAGIAAGAAQAQSFRAVNHMTVTPTGPNSFTVSGQASLWARDYWCAAGEYAQKKLGAGVTTRLYVVAPYVRGARTVGFSTDPGGLTPLGALSLGSTVRNAGSDMSTGRARAYCADRILRGGPGG